MQAVETVRESCVGESIGEVVNGGVVLWRWRYEYYGATLEADLVYYAPYKFCLEATLEYGGVVKVAEGEVCAERSTSGGVKVSADTTIKVAGKKVAAFEGAVTFRVDYAAGYAYLDGYSMEVCGTNTIELKCKTWSWQRDSKNGGPLPIGDQVFLPSASRGTSEDELFKLVLSTKREIGPKFAAPLS